MKKVILSAAVLAFAFSFTSCKKCGECVGASGVTQGEVCKDDVGQLLYDTYKNSCSASGGTWED